MRRSHIFARELRGVVIVALVALMIMWLFGKIGDDRLEAKERSALTRPAATTTTTTATTIVEEVDDDERLCSLSRAFRDDLSMLVVVLVDTAGNEISSPGGLPIDVGLHPDGALITDPDVLNGEVEPEAAIAVPPPRITDPEQIDPVRSGLLGEPQRSALNFYAAAATLRLGLVGADFDAAANYFADFVGIGEPLDWNLVELSESDFSDRWVALSTRPVISVDNTLLYIEETCEVRIGNRFLYREEVPELPILKEVPVPALIDPEIDPSLRPTPPVTTG